MSSIKNVAIFGASGSLGAPILKELIDSGKFNITVISRKESKATFPSSIKALSVDYTSLSELTEALRGQDAVVSAVGTDGFLGQKAFVDAAIAAGVSRILPSEFGSNLSHPKVGALAVFGYKQAVRQYIEEKVAGGANITYTYVINSAFLDWGLGHGFLLNYQGGKPEIYDSGDQLFSATLLSTVGKAVVGVLTHPEETKNRQVAVQDVQISQNKLLALAKKAAPEKVGKWETVPVKIADVEKSTGEALAKGDFSLPVIFDQLKLSIFGSAGYGQPLKDDNELLGVQSTVSDDDIVAIWKRLLA